MQSRRTGDDGAEGAGLRARCDTCSARPACARAGALRPEYPACHQPARRTDLARLAALLRACDRGAASPRLDALIALVCSRHRLDRERFSEVMELSVSRAAGSERALRFSYALPNFREDFAACAAFVRAFAALHGGEGGATARLFEGALDLLLDPCVALPLVGVEDEGERYRAKIYLQFADGAGGAGAALITRWLPWLGGVARLDTRRLHMVGVDVGPAGVVGAKLYLDASPLALDGPLAVGFPVLAGLRAARLESLGDALAVHRVGASGELRDEPDEIDVGLAANEVPWGALRSLGPVAARRPAALDAIEAGFQIAVRRLSFDRGDKLTAYHVLTELEAPGEDAPGAPPAPRPGRARAPVVRTDAAARRLLGPLLEAKLGASGWRLVSWDAEQGISVVLGRRDRFILVELEARDEARDCYARTRRFNVCARSQFTPDGSLRAEERALVDGLIRFVRGREGLITIDERAPEVAGQSREIEVDRVLMPEGAGRYYLNPFAGCTVGCTFCYVAPRAELSRRLDGAPPPPWGRWVDVKVNAPAVLAREVRQHPPGLVRISPILTDPYQPIERRYRVTRGCLTVLLEAGFSPAILTRESLVLDDLDLLTRHRERAAVGFSIPTDDERLRAIFEPRSDTLENRFAALRALSERGVATCLVVQPALPMLDVDAFVARTAPWIRAVRVDRMYFEERVAERYAAAGVDPSPARQAKLVERLTGAYRAAGVVVDENDDLAGLLEAMICPR